MTTLSYEEQRAQNIRDNEALLLSLGLATPNSKPPKVAKPKPKPKSKAVVKRETAAYKDTGSGDDDDDEEEDAPRRSGRERKPKTEESPAPRRSSRRVSRADKKRARSVSDASDDDDYTYRAPKRVNRDPERKAQRLGVRTQDPAQFGHIPGIDVGTTWASRMDCSTDAVHAPPVAGISGNAEVGAWSVALSGGYPDDVDLGEAFTYTGSGGRDLKGTKNAPKNLRTAPQTSNQSFEHSFNAALKKSAETGKPVRVIRGFKLDSKYAPAEGYRYDGLYIVKKAWMAKGLTKGLLVCRYAFQRVKGQPPLPELGAEGEEEAEAEGEGGEGEDGEGEDGEGEDGEGEDGEGEDGEGGDGVEDGQGSEGEVDEEEEPKAKDEVKGKRGRPRRSTRK